MDEVINEKVSVILVDDINKGSTIPAKLRWRGKTYVIDKCTNHYKTRQGRTIVHVFSVASDMMYFKLSLNTETLHWTLLETYDGASV